MLAASSSLFWLSGRQKTPEQREILRRERINSAGPDHGRNLLTGRNSIPTDHSVQMPSTPMGWPACSMSARRT